MAFKALLASVLLVQSALGQCVGRTASPCGSAGYGLAGYGAGLAGYGAGLAGYGAGCGSSGVASTGGGLPVSSISPIAPVGVSVISENAYEGQLSAGGNLPFLGGVAIEGSFPSGGLGAVSYGCGDGLVGVASEAPIYTGVANPGALFPPNSPSPAATNAAVLFGLQGSYGIGGNAYGLGNASGYGHGGAGCGCSC